MSLWGTHSEERRTERKALDYFGSHNDSYGVLPITDPFKNECIEKICVFCYPNSTYNKPVSGHICFRNGNTKGEQEFEGTDIVSVIKEMYRFCEQLQRR